MVLVEEVEVLIGRSLIIYFNKIEGTANNYGYSSNRLARCTDTAVETLMFYWMEIPLFLFI